MGEDWRQRYLKLADEQERSEAIRDKSERELVRLITRLCVAVSGLDPALDPHLERLRRSAKGGKVDKLLSQADELADSLVRISEERVRPGVVQRLFEHAGLSKRQSDEALKVWAAVAADPAAAGNADLDRLAAVLKDAVAAVDAEAAQPASGGGLLNRLIGRRAGVNGPPPNQTLSELLQAINWPEALQGRVDECHARLGGDAAADAWTGVVREVSDLAITALTEAQQSARSAETFLAELSRHLESFDQHMRAEVQRAADSRASGERLGRTMSDEVESLSDSVRHSADLAQLQASVLASLDRMQTHVREHIEDENARRSRAEAEADALREQLKALERDTFDLRREVAKTQEQAMRDALTDLPNRRAYDERVAQEQARFRRFGEPLALLVLDIDDFKQINDTFGHKAGDKTLSMIGRILKERLRATDFIARFGGEEFVLLLTGAQQVDALRVADAMREAVEQGGLHAHGEPVKVTVSGGLAMFGADETAEHVFERADKALYAAKGEGKNRIVSG